jgi:hypothetical protein
MRLRICVGEEMDKIVREEAWDVDDDDNKVLGSRWAIALLACLFLCCTV